MVINTITSDAKSSNDVTFNEVDVVNGLLRGQRQNPQRFCAVRGNGQQHMTLRKARILCNIQGHSPWRSCRNSRKLSLLLSFQKQRKNSSFSLSRKIQNEYGFTDRIQHRFGEVFQRMYATASEVEAVPVPG